MSQLTTDAAPASILSREWVFIAAPPAPFDAPSGAVLREADARALNIAPRRWLLLGEAPRLREQALGGGALEFETHGRWRVIDLARDSPALRAALDVEAALANRGCLSMTLFDTPAHLYAHEQPQRVRVCVPASFADGFLRQVRAIEAR